MNGRGFEVEGGTNFVGLGSCPESSWIATQLVRTVASDGRVRRWQWEMRKHKRPPNQGSWFIESIGSSDKDGDFEAD